MQNPTAVLHGINDLRLDDRPIPTPAAGEVQLEMKSVGICGSDIHYWTHGAIGDFIVKEPMVIGHEPSGVVSALGAGVTHLKIGDRVAIEPGVPCKTCSICLQGRYNLCDKMSFCATPPVDGCLAKYYVHDASFCHKLPDNISFEEAALIEPLSVAIHACKRGGVKLGSNVLVCGSGPIGLVCVLIAKASGASKVVITDINDGRLAVAKQLGADFTLNVMNIEPKSLANKVEALLGSSPDVTLECTGVEPSVHGAIYSTKPGGCCMTIGMGKPMTSLPLLDAACREVDIRGVFRYCNTYPTAIQMLSSKSVDPTPLITHRFTLDQYLEAFEVSKTGRDGAIKVMINVSS